MRDLRRTASQLLAIALVIACAVAAVVMAADTRRSLERTLHAYYEQYRFAHVFAAVERAPEDLLPALRAIRGVAELETRITTWAALTPPDMEESTAAQVLSVPAVGGPPAVNRIVLRAGRLPAPGRPDEIVLAEPFAQAHGLAPGRTLRARLAGEARELEIVGLALAPEAVFAVGPGQIVPDERRYALLWMNREALAEALPLENEFNEALVRLTPSADESAVIAALDTMLAPFGATGAYGRGDHPSHAFVEGQLDQLAALALVLPPLFLLVAGVLVHGAVRRIVESERREIGILAALGIGRAAIRAHYLQYAAALALLGSALGFVLGWWMGSVLTDLYTRFFRFPLTVREIEASAAVLATVSALLVACTSAAIAASGILRLAPADAMRAPSPPVYRRVLSWRALGERARMIVRQLLRHRRRASITAAATALAIGLVVATAFSFDALDHMIEVTAASERQDATLLFSSPVPETALQALRALPGVQRAEGFRTARAELSAHGRRMAAPLVALPRDGTLRQLLDADLRPMPLPAADGIALTGALARALGVSSGDEVELRLPEVATPIPVVVAALTEQYFGVEATVALPALERWSSQAALVSGARMELDRSELAELHRSLRELLPFAGYVDQQATLAAFRSTMMGTLTIVVTFFVLFAVLTTVGVVYTNARVLLAERRRELVMLRALGFSHAQVSTLLLAELLAPALLAVPLGLALGRVFGSWLVHNLDSTLFRVPLVVAPRTDAAAVAITLLATLVAGLLVARAASRLDIARTLAEDG